MSAKRRVSQEDLDAQTAAILQKRRQEQIAIMPRLEFPSEYAGETIYVSKPLYEGITRKVNVTKIKPYGGQGGHVIIEYTPKRGGGSGELILFCIGPAPSK